MPKNKNYNTAPKRKKGAQSVKNSSPDKMRALKKLLTPQAVRKAEEAMIAAVAGLADPRCSEIISVPSQRRKRSPKRKLRTNRSDHGQ